ncbi:MAG: hypothetical protein EOO98_12865 [Pedobacter sp.]|nr:MAG: hypothetical protein EOO98_12865 [Pedobacter sp.]
MKKTTKAQSTQTETLVKTADLAQLELSSATKETKAYLYRTDGTLYSYKNVKEQIDHKGYETANIKEQANAKKEITTKEAEPSQMWMYITGGIILILVFAYKWRLYRAKY